jgi:CRISPR/Cas system-associated endoribonuclease Cas2
MKWASTVKKHITGTKRGEIAKIALYGLLVLGFIPMLAMAPGLGALLKLIDPNPRKAMYKLERALLGLERQGRVIRATKNGERGYMITDKGRLEFARRRFDEYTFPASKGSYWDGKWRLVFFDVPEKRKSTRQILRRKLIELGFYRLQDSVFIFPYPCAEFISLAHEAWQLEKCLRFAIVSEIDREDFFLHHFRLTRKS